jgi:hypothetical protein
MLGAGEGGTGVGAVGGLVCCGAGVDVPLFGTAPEAGCGGTCCEECGGMAGNGPPEPYPC